MGNAPTIIFTQPGSARGAARGVGYLCALPTGAALYQAMQRGSPWLAAAVLFLLCTLVLAVALLFSAEVIVQLSEDGLLVRQRRQLAGWRGRSRILFAVSYSALRDVRQVIHKRPTQHGGYELRYALRFSRQVTLDARLLGGGDNRRSVYWELVRELESLLGRSLRPDHLRSSYPALPPSRPYCGEGKTRPMPAWRGEFTASEK